VLRSSYTSTATRPLSTERTITIEQQTRCSEILGRKQMEGRYTNHGAPRGNTLNKLGRARQLKIG
jgi:hypothetical protein